MGKWVHRLSNVDEEAKEGDCVACGRVAVKRKKLPSGSYRWVCKVSDKRWNPGSRASFGCTPEVFDAMMRKQRGRCAICKRSIDRQTACADHDHQTGLLRDLLCRSCNIGLGLFGDRAQTLERAAVYLRRHKQKPSR